MDKSIKGLKYSLPNTTNINNPNVNNDNNVSINFYFLIKNTRVMKINVLRKSEIIRIL